MMDIHLAYSIPFFIYIAGWGYKGNIIDLVFIFVRFIITCFEAIFIYILTDDEIINANKFNS